MGGKQSKQSKQSKLELKPAFNKNKMLLASAPKLELFRSLDLSVQPPSYDVSIRDDLNDRRIALDAQRRAIDAERSSLNTERKVLEDEKYAFDAQLALAAKRKMAIKKVNTVKNDYRTRTRSKGLSGRGNRGNRKRRHRH